MLRKFEARWLEEAECEAWVEEAWGQALLVGGAEGFVGGGA